MTISIEQSLIFTLLVSIVALGIGYASGYDFGKRAGYEQGINTVFPNYRERLLEAESAGLHQCHACGFSFYRAVDNCPKCNHRRVE